MVWPALRVAGVWPVVFCDLSIVSFVSVFGVGGSWVAFGVVDLLVLPLCVARRCYQAGVR
jgi:hypothetical protein